MASNFIPIQLSSKVMDLLLDAQWMVLLCLRAIDANVSDTELADSAIRKVLGENMMRVFRANQTTLPA